MYALPPELEAWFAARGWRVRQHQSEMLAASEAGRHALLVADTGAGKTLAGFLPTLAAFCPSRGALPEDGLHTLYVSPLKALAHDVQRNLLTPVEEIGLPIRIETRSGDTPSDRKKRQRNCDRNAGNPCSLGVRCHVLFATCAPFSKKTCCAGRPHGLHSPTPVSWPTAT